MDKAHERFVQTGEGVTVTHVPQCSGCTKNIGYGTCQAFKDKPEKYPLNRESCPERVSE